MNNSQLINYVCLERMNNQGMQYTFTTDPITYSCTVLPEEAFQSENWSDMQRPISREGYERTSSPELANNRPLDVGQSQCPANCMFERLSTSPIPKIWTLRYGIPTPPPLPERLPVTRYRISFNWTQADTLIKAHRFPLKTRDWGDRAISFGKAGSEEDTITRLQDSLPSKKPQPTRYKKKLHKARKVQPPKIEAEQQETTVIEDMAYVFPAGVNALGVLENTLGKWVHSKSLEAHGEQLQKVAHQSVAPETTVGGALM